MKDNYYTLTSFWNYFFNSQKYLMKNYSQVFLPSELLLAQPVAVDCSALNDPFDFITPTFSPVALKLQDCFGKFRTLTLDNRGYFGDNGSDFLLTTKKY